MSRHALRMLAVDGGRSLRAEAYPEDHAGLRVLYRRGFVPVGFSAGRVVLERCSAEDPTPLTRAAVASRQASLLRSRA